MYVLAPASIDRLHQLGIKKVYGVPGDFNLAFLDLVEDFKGLDWVGNCNELNASYAADGYARVAEGTVPPCRTCQADVLPRSWHRVCRHHIRSRGAFCCQRHWCVRLDVHACLS